MQTFLKPEQISAKYLKKELMNYLFYRLNYPVVVDEHNFMDVFGVRRSGYTVEYEIKISKADLMREIHLQKSEQPVKYSKDWTKWEKHANYLGRIISKMPSIWDSIPGYEDKAPKFFIPNEFYFYVPDFLSDLAAREVVGTPYGVIQIGKWQNSYGREYFSKYEIVVAAKKMHTNKVTENIYREIAHELTTRNKIFYQTSN